MLFVNCNLLRIKSGISCHLSLRQDTKGWVHWAVWKSGWRPDHSKYSTCTDLVWWQSNSIKEVWQSKYPTAASSWTWKKNMTHQHQTTLNLSGCITPISTAMVQKIQWNSQTAWNKTPIDPKFSSSDNQSNENSNKKTTKRSSCPSYWRNLWPTVVKLRSRLRRYPKSAVECSRGLPC